MQHTPRVVEELDGLVEVLPAHLQLVLCHELLQTLCLDHRERAVDETLCLLLQQVCQDEVVGGDLSPHHLVAPQLGTERGRGSPVQYQCRGSAISVQGQCNISAGAVQYQCRASAISVQGQCNISAGPVQYQCRASHCAPCNDIRTHTYLSTTSLTLSISSFSPRLLR